MVIRKSLVLSVRQAGGRSLAKGVYRSRSNRMERFGFVIIAAGKVA